MNCAVLLPLLLFISLAYSTTLEDVPACALSSLVCIHLLPGALGRLSFVCKSIFPTAQKALKQIYGKIQDYQLVIDVERLYDLYHELHDEYQFEKGAIQKLIEANLPVPSVPLNGFDRLRAELFVPDYISNFNDVSKHYPELSRMILKHKKPVNTESVLSKTLAHPSFSDLVLGHYPAIDFVTLHDCLKQCNPRKVVKFFQRLSWKSAALTTILQAGEFDFLLQTPQDIDLAVMLLLVCMADELNMEKIISALNLSDYTNFSVEFLVPWAKYQQLRPVLIRISETVEMEEELKCQLVVKLSKYPNPFPLYCALRGTKVVEGTVEFLNGLIESPFASEPNEFGIAQLVETALVLDYPEDVISSLIECQDFCHSFPLLVLFLTKKKSTPLLLKLVQSETASGYDLDGFTDLPEINPDVFRFIISNRLNNRTDAIRLLCMTGDGVSLLKLFQILIHEFSLDDSEFKYLLDLDDFWGCPDISDIRRELIQAAFDRGLELVWTLETETKELHDLVTQFFDSKDTEALLLYLPKDGKNRNLMDYGILGTSYFIAICSLSSRLGGVELLRSHLDCEEYLMELLMFAQHPQTDFIILLQRVLDRPSNMASSVHDALLTPFHADLPKQFLKFLTGPNIDTDTSGNLLVFFETLVCRFMVMKTPLCHIYPLELLSRSQVEIIFRNSDCHMLTIENKYYRTHVPLFLSSLHS